MTQYIEIHGELFKVDTSSDGIVTLSKHHGVPPKIKAALTDFLSRSHPVPQLNRYSFTVIK